MKFCLPPTAPGFPLCPQHGLSPCGLHFPRTFIHSHLPPLGGWGSPNPAPGSLHAPWLTAWKEADVATTPSWQRLPQPSSQRAGARQLPGKGRRNSHGTTGLFFFFFFLDSDVTVWWQESYPVSFPSSHNNPVPENLPLRAQNISLRHVKMRAKPLGVRPNTACEHESSQRPPALPSSICKTPRFQSCREKNRGNRAAPAPFQSGRRLKKSKHLTILSIMLHLGTNMASLVSYTLTPQGCS